MNMLRRASWNTGAWRRGPFCGKQTGGAQRDYISYCAGLCGFARTAGLKMARMLKAAAAGRRRRPPAAAAAAAAATRGRCTRDSAAPVVPRDSAHMIVRQQLGAVCREQVVVGTLAATLARLLLGTGSAVSGAGEPKWLTDS